MAARSKGPQNRKSPPGISPERVLYNLPMLMPLAERDPRRAGGILHNQTLLA
jgi:hypothetical protein